LAVAVENMRDAWSATVAPVTQLRPDAEAIFKDSYLVDFLGLPEAHSEQELQTAIIVNLKRLLLELGRDFAFVGEQYMLPAGHARS
jgi:predicted nuclease of restriction endonuclease-like (RecB) superfamily